MHYLSLVLCFLLSSCSIFYNVNDSNIIKYHEPKQIESQFLIDGRFFIKYDEKSYYGNFFWVHNELEDNLDFKSPLGQVFARLSINNKIKSINLLIQEHEYIGDDIKVIMEQNLGFYLPFEYLYFWVSGFAVPNYPVNKYFYNGFRQFDFDVYFISWYDNSHPKIIKIINNNMSIKLFLIWKN